LYFWGFNTAAFYKGFFLLKNRLLSSFLSFILPSFIYSYFSGTILLLGFVALIAALIKSAVQFKPDGKAVFITGQVFLLFLSIGKLFY